MDIKKPVISIIIPIYNTQKYLSRCIGSVLEQTYQDFELILVDDGSTDNSLELCRKWSKIDQRIVLISQENGGVSKARNAGLDVAKGKYITFIDSDDWVSSNYLAVLLETMEKNDAQLVVGSFRRMYTRLNESSLSPLPTKKFNIADNEEVRSMLFSDHFRGPWVKLFLNEIIQNNILRFPLNVKIGEDTIFLMNYLSKCTLIYTVSNVIYYYNRMNELAATTKYYAEIFDWRILLVLGLKNLLNNWDIKEEYGKKMLTEEATSFWVERCHNVVIHHHKSKNKSEGLVKIQHGLDVLGDYISVDYIKDGELRKAFEKKDAEMIYDVILALERRQRVVRWCRNALKRIVNPWLEVHRDGLRKYDYMIEQ